MNEPHSSILHNKHAITIVASLFFLAVCNGMTGSYISFYIVKGLGKEPALMSLYSLIGVLVTVTTNRQIGKWIDKGVSAKRLVLLTMGAFVVGNLAISLTESYWILVSVTCVCLGIASGNMAALYSMGRVYAGKNGLHIDRYNSLLRAATSMGWMVGPAVSYGLVTVFPPIVIFKVAGCLGVLWLAMWFSLMPYNHYVQSQKQTEDKQSSAKTDRSLLLAVIVCFCFSIAHTLCAGALPLYFVQEVGLPVYSPGISLSIKTFVEIIAILASPMMIRHFGAKNVLLADTILASVAFIILSRVDSLFGLVVGSALEGAYYGLFAGVGMAFVQNLANGRIGKAMSMYMNSLFIGGLIASPAVGLIAQFWSFKTSILVAMSGVICAFIILVVWIMSERNSDKNKLVA